jgi:hypothetical protein
MAVDLTSNSMFARISFVMMDDSLIKLEHGSTKDRVRRFRFVDIEAMVFTRSVPILRLVLSTIAFLLPGVAFLVFGGEVATSVVGIILAAIGFALIAWYLYAGWTTIYIIRAHQPGPEKITGIFRPGKLARLKESLVDKIRAAQAAAALRESAMQAGTLTSDQTAAAVIEVSNPPPIPPPVAGISGAGELPPPISRQ